MDLTLVPVAALVVAALVVAALVVAALVVALVPVPLEPGQALTSQSMSGRRWSWPWPCPCPWHRPTWGWAVGSHAWGVGAGKLHPRPSTPWGLTRTRRWRRGLVGVSEVATPTV